MGKKVHSEEERLYLKKFGKRVKDLRKQSKITQAEIAFRMGMATQSISDIENGKTDCQQTTSYLIAKALGVDLNKLYTFDEMKDE